MVDPGSRKAADPPGNHRSRHGLQRAGRLGGFVWDGPGTLAASNAAEVKRIRTVLEAMHYKIATPDEARQILSLKGREGLRF